jgi:molybdopterin-binding protein
MYLRGLVPIWRSLFEYSIYPFESASGSTMKLSARNQIKGKVLEVVKGATTSLVLVEIARGKVITSSITNEAVKDLDPEGWPYSKLLLSKRLT